MCQVSFLYGHSYASSVLVKKRENSNIQSGENRHYIQFSNFFKFRPLNESLELETIFPQISSPKGMFGRNKKKFDFSRLSFDSRNSQKIALKTSVLQPIWMEFFEGSVSYQVKNLTAKAIRRLKVD